MALGRTALVALLLAACAAVVTARTGPAENVREWAHEVSDAVEELANEGVRVVEAAAFSELGRKDRHEEENPGFEFLVKHIVRPSLGKEFVGQWLKVRDEAKTANGSVAFTLSKPLTDNVLFYSYQKWDSKEDFFSFIKESEEAKTLGKYVEEKDIPITFTQLIPIPEYRHGKHHHGEHEHGHHHHGESRRDQLPLRELLDEPQAAAYLQGADSQVGAALRAASNDDRDPKKAILLTKFIVKPSELFDFVKVTKLITHAVREEESDTNEAYGYTAELGNDYTVWNYAVWDSEHAVKEHLKSKYARKFLEYVLENDILTTTIPLLPIDGEED